MKGNHRFHGGVMAFHVLLGFLVMQVLLGEELPGRKKGQKKYGQWQTLHCALLTKALGTVLGEDGMYTPPGRKRFPKGKRQSIPCRPGILLALFMDK